MDTTVSLHFMNQEFAKLNQFDELAPIPDNPIPEEGKTVDPTVITKLEKQRTLHRESEELCVGHIKNSLSDWLYDLYSPVKDPRELWNALELK
uniref:Uncharacterized protein n=1 Tax=Lactuca sativa TaxID=4236 RepID=A0A9R1VEV1_LACSA|nr:hypothetical protein LSAT_V11C500270110 [Lactuca sativa]